MLRAEQARSLQPRLLGNPVPGTGHRLEKLKSLCRDLENQFGLVPESEQDFVLAQLDLIRGTMARHKTKAAALGPAVEEPAAKNRRRVNSPLPSPEDRKLFS